MKKSIISLVLFGVLLLPAVIFATEQNVSEEKDSVDLCLNIEGKQTEIPGGHFTNNGDCLVFNENGMPKMQEIVVNQTVVDLCSNIEGDQKDIPEGYKKIDGLCVKTVVIVPTVAVPYDFCSNYNGVQKTLPAGFKRPEGSSICTPINPPANSDSKCPVGSWPIDGGECRLDVCFNMRGAQSAIPDGYEMKTPGQCTVKPKPAPVVVDMCLNIANNQSKIPTGFTRHNGNCYRTNDLCWNIPETQKDIPTGYTAIDRTCSPIETKK